MRSSNKRLLSIFKQCCEKGTRERCHRPNSEVLARERERVGPVEVPGAADLEAHAAQQGRAGSARDRPIFNFDHSGLALDQSHRRKPDTVEKGPGCFDAVRLTEIRRAATAARRS